MTITDKNVFLNGFRASKKARLRSFMFRTVHVKGADKKSKRDVNKLHDLSFALERWLRKKLKRRYIVLVFNAFGGKFKKRGQSRSSLFKKSLAFLDTFRWMDNKPFVCIVANNAIAFNGCKTSNVRRTRRKYFIKHQ